MRDHPKKSPHRQRREHARAPRERTRSPSGATTLKDIAKVAGVSAQTVSCAINGTGAVSEEMRARIRQIAEEMNYRPNRSAKAMRTGRSQTFGFVLTDIRNPFFPELAYAVQRAAANAGYSIILVDTFGPHEEAAERIATLRMHAVDGVLTTVYSEPIAALDLPTVIIGNPAPGIDSIRADDELGGTLLADHLLAKGHRRVGMVTSPAGGCVPVRRQAFIERFSRLGTTVWEVYTPPSEVVDEAVKAKLRREDVTALVCSHDPIAVGVMRALHEQGRRIPRDISVVGFDDIPWAAIVTPALTTVRQPTEGMGAGAIALLLARIVDPAARVKRLKLPMRLIERETVADLTTGAMASPVAELRQNFGIS